MTDILNAAMGYAKRGWKVFPLEGKIPLKGSKGFKDATLDGEKIKTWFSDGKHNIGIATGKVSGIFVLDVDNKAHKNKFGDEELKEIESAHQAIPDTVEAMTPSGGRHLYFNYPEEGIDNRADFRNGLDVRGDGGYVVAPPSTLNGKNYEWEASSHPNDIPIADAPVWLMGIMKTKSPVLVTSSTANIDEGSRDDALTKIAGTLHAQAHLDTEDLYNALLIINMKRCNPPLLDKDIMKIAKSVNSYPKLPDSFFEPLTDSWNGRMLCKLYGQDIKFCDGLGGWFNWTEKNWQVDKKFKMYRTCQEVSNKLLRRSAMMNNDDKQKKIIYKHAVSMQAENKINSMLRLARCENGITHDTDDFDNDPWLFNCHNGTLHLKSDAFYPQKREDLITRGLEIPFEHKAKCPEWMKFLRSVFLEDDDLILFMQKAVGYALSGNVSEDCMFMFYGNGSNGKSTFLKHLLNILGAYAITTPADTLLEKKGDAPLNDIARLKGHRFVSCVESARARYMDEARVKQMTGGDIIPARFLYREYFEFYSTFKIFFATNNLPIVSEFSDGIWRRLLPIPFNNQYLAGDRDMKLDMKLSQEYAGILRWAIEGFRLWSDNGLGTTPCIDKLKAEYRAESNLVDTFITEKCTVNHESDYVFTSSVDIWKVFHEWNIGMGGKRYKQKEFYDYLKNKGFDKMKNSADHGRHYFSGIMVREGDEKIKGDW